MPCNSDYMEPTEHEKQSRLVAELLLYVDEELGIPQEPGLVEIANHIYGDKQKLDEMVSDLCELVRTMTPDQLNKIMYNGRNAQARKLADWWERHEQADQDREQQERERKQEELEELLERVAILEEELDQY